jgi:hypothetical protein
MDNKINNVLYQNCTTCKKKNTSACPECTECDIKTQMIYIAERIGGAALEKRQQ